MGAFFDYSYMKMNVQPKCYFINKIAIKDFKQTLHYTYTYMYIYEK